MLHAYLKLLLQKLTASISGAVSRIDHNAVMKDLASRADLSGSYLLMILFSCLIALLGLLVNSVAVVIGAMLISPLMGPIFTAGLAFSMGDLRLARRSLRIIVYSILLTVLVTAFFTLLSPLKAPTQEILSRTRPNIYDLVIAALSGAVGAYALCTRVDYLFVTTGVAVATAVIPPLSVVGYGVGTGQAAIALGGFLLFFTNLVAIVISSDVVFHIFRFRASMIEEARYPVRRRIQILGGVLALISVPLVYTLVTDIRKVKLTGRIERVLKSHLDRNDHSRLTTFSYQRGDKGVTVSASVNTVKYFDDAREKEIERDLKNVLSTPVRLDLEQVIVKSGGVEPQFPVPSLPLALPTPPRPESLAVLKQKSIGLVTAGCQEAQAFLAPYPVRQCGIRFSDQGKDTVLMTIGRDYPLSDEEQRWLLVALEKKLDEPLALEVETVPLLPPITFGSDGKPDEASRKALAILKELAAKGLDQYIVITAPHMTRNNIALVKRELDALKHYLITELNIPSISIIRGPNRGTDMRVAVGPDQQQ